MNFYDPLATPALIRSPPQLVEAYIHQELVLPCEATNYDENLEIAYAWAHNGLRIDFWKESDVYRLVRIGNPIYCKNSSSPFHNYALLILLNFLHSIREI